jgi:Fe2+ or Zn2+ uptake regulation protein
MQHIELICIISIANHLHLIYTICMNSTKNIQYSTLLHKAGMRATPGKLKLLEVLDTEQKPLTVYEIEKKLGQSMNQVTVYRSLDALYKAQIVKRVNLEHDHAHFELAAGREHHHHAVCRNCGYIENIEIPHAAKPELEALKQTKGFSMLDSYSLEFFGLCKKCTKQ